MTFQLRLFCLVASSIVPAALALCAPPARAQVPGQAGLVSEMYMDCKGASPRAVPIDQDTILEVGGQRITQHQQFVSNGKQVVRVVPGESIRREHPGAFVKEITLENRWTEGKPNEVQRPGPTNAPVQMDFYDASMKMVVAIEICAADSSPCGSGQADAVREFRESMLPVLRHPRCANCHGAMDIFDKSTSHPGGSFADREEELREKAWAPCTQCHDLGQSDDERQWRVPLADLPRWGMLSDRKMCDRLKESAPTPDDFLAHLQDDFRIRLGFAGTRGQKDLDAVPPPLTQPQFLKSAHHWIDAMDKQNWMKPQCGCDGLSDQPPPPPARTDCRAAVDRVQDALTAESDALVNAKKTACDVKRLPPESRAGRPEAINAAAQNNYAKARQETTAAYAAAKGCDTSGARRPEVDSGAADYGSFMTCLYQYHIDHFWDSSRVHPAACDALYEELKCEGIKVPQRELPIQDSGNTVREPYVPNDVKPECRDAYLQFKAAQGRADELQRSVDETARTIVGSGPRGNEVLKAYRAGRDKAFAERERAQAAFNACQGNRADQTQLRNAVIAPAGDQPKAWEPGTMRSGPDLEMLPMNKADPKECKAMCQRYNGCKAFTYVGPEATSDGSALCQIKGGVGPATRDSCCVSGLP